MPWSIFRAARLGLIAAAMAACGSDSGQLTPSVTTTTLMAGWERHFALDWTVEPEPSGARRLRGTISSNSGAHAESLRLLAQALDASGALLGQQIAHVPGGVAGFAGAYFEISSLPSADHYRVSVWDYTFRQS